MLADILYHQSQSDEVALMIINESYNWTLLERIDRKKIEVKLLHRPPASRNPYYILKF